MSTQGCLVTADPDTYDAEQTPPFLVAGGLAPDPRRIYRLGGDSGIDQLDISASVVSEDEGRTVKAAIFIDYGFKNVEEQPFRFALLNFPELAAGTLSQGPRPLTGVRYRLGSYPLTAGCHRITLVVSHEFDTKTQCPKDLFDSDQVTWQFNRCDDGGGECAEAVEDCPPIEATCPKAPAEGTQSAASGAREDEP
ncbi:hypothetical protein [Polyangium aurulentum]|uniref:hypothetical protein n=1 Tax=Polyangium aurulentum TaxID=2567896 RepID=UPI0010AEC145|nr:hypothetical protein [Polyangium aurulentum]UQA62639.1 hypothetical protein E8A73_020165 [Polyangium aurulentum]